MGEVLSSVVAGIILLVITPFVAGWLKLEQTDEGLRITRPQREVAPVEPPTPLARNIRLSSEGDRPDSTRLAGDVEPIVRQSLRARGDVEGLTIHYRVAALGFADSANRRATLSYAIGLPGKSGAACDAREVRFHSGAVLAERLTERINASIAATEQRGEPKCQ